ncbi:hypothetical protein [Amphritea sp. HPY]|uniref:hypothetical protein n=1 Tax=Amphritea sp. HPY TaxID=3421652 RepID=UPI003D7C4DE1
MSTRATKIPTETIELDYFDQYLDKIGHELESALIELAEFHYEPLKNGLIKGKHDLNRSENYLISAAVAT